MFVGKKFPGIKAMANFMNENLDHRVVCMSAEIEIVAIFEVESVDKPVEAVEKIEADEKPKTKKKARKKKVSKKA